MAVCVNDVERKKGIGKNFVYLGAAGGSLLRGLDLGLLQKNIIR